MITTTLAAFPSPAQGVWHLGPVPIRAYAVCIIIGIVVALVIGDRRWAARGGEKGVIYDIALWAVPFGLIGGRLYHVLTDWTTYFGPDGAGLLAALKVWHGGLGIWGAVALGGVGAWIACRQRGIPLPAFGDAIAPGIVLAQGIGRVGNYFNQELYGRPTTVPWGMEVFYRSDPSGGLPTVSSLDGVSTGQVYAVVHPTFLYELLWNILVFVILILVDRRYKIGHGRLFALYVALYCVGRFCVELLRSDAATEFAGIRINSFTSTFVFLGAVVYIILAKKGREDPRTLAGPDEADDEQVPALAKELAAVAADTGLVAAATVAGREDVAAAEQDVQDVEVPDPTDTPDVLETVEEVESADEFEALDHAAAEPDESAPAADADDVAPDAEDEAIIEAAVAAPGIGVESGPDAESDLLDEDHDPIDEDELEGLSEGVAMGAPASEQAEFLESDPADGDPDPVPDVVEPEASEVSVTAESAPPPDVPDEVAPAEPVDEPISEAAEVSAAEEVSEGASDVGDAQAVDTGTDHVEAVDVDEADQQMDADAETLDSESADGPAGPRPGVEEDESVVLEAQPVEAESAAVEADGTAAESADAESTDAESRDAESAVGVSDIDGEPADPEQSAGDGEPAEPEQPEAENAVESANAEPEAVPAAPAPIPATTAGRSVRESRFRRLFRRR